MLDASKSNALPQHRSDWVLNSCIFWAPDAANAALLGVDVSILSCLHLTASSAIDPLTYDAVDPSHTLIVWEVHPAW